jgi:glycosyltransferase involved in cell wall biosynthesis
VPFLFPKAGGLRRQVLLAPTRGADLVIATNAQDYAELVRRMGPERLAAVPIGSNVTAPADRQAATALPPGARRVATFGLMNAEKGILELLAAVARLVAEGRDVHLVVVGGSPGTSDPTNAADETAAVRTAAKLGISDRVHVTGFVPPEVAAAELAVADVVAQPYRDGASLRRGSLMAAWHYGAPVVTTAPAAFGHDPAPGLPQIDPQAAIFVPARDDAALASALARVLDDPDLRNRLREGSLRMAEQFRWEGIAARHCALYRGLGGRAA